MLLLWLLFISLIVSAVVGTIVRDRYDGVVMGAFLGVLSWFGIWVVLFVLVFAPSTWWWGDRPHEQRYELVSAQDVTGIRGSFVFGTGSIESGLQLNFYYEENGAKRPHSTGHNDVSVRDVPAGEKPYVVQHWRDCTWWLVCLPGGEFAIAYDFYVPPGSVVNNFKLDAQ